MPKITCKQCGATGSSKNPWTRSVFMDDKLEAVFSQCFQYKIDRTRPDSPVIMFNLRYIIGENDTDEYECVKSGLEFLKKYLEHCPIESLACNHGDKGWEIEGELDV